MKVVLSPVIADISGKVKDVVFASWRGRHYVRSRNVPTGPPSPAQQLIRNNYAKGSYLWQQFNDEYKNAWRAHATGKNKSAFNFWMNIAIVASSIYNVFASTPDSPTVPRIIGLTAAQSATSRGIDLFWTDGPLGPDYYVNVLLRKNGSAVWEFAEHDTTRVDDWTTTVIGTAAATLFYVYVCAQNVNTRELSISTYRISKTG